MNRKMALKVNGKYILYVKKNFNIRMNVYEYECKLIQINSNFE